MTLPGKVVVVTGASRGVGEAIARDLARRGAHVVVGARDRDRLELVAGEIRAAGGQATVAAADVSTAEGRATLLSRAEGVGPVDVLVNNAGIEVAVALVDQTPEEIDRQLVVDLAAPIQLARAVFEKMLARRAGCVVMVSSMSGKLATPYNAVYAAAKFGLVGFTASVRPELDGTGVHIGVVCPGFVAGGMWASTGLKAPRWMREVTVEDVVAAVRKVIAGAPEVLVTGRAIRLALAVNALFPPFEASALRWSGAQRTLKQRAEGLQRVRR